MWWDGLWDVQSGESWRVLMGEGYHLVDTALDEMFFQHILSCCEGWRERHFVGILNTWSKPANNNKNETVESGDMKDPLKGLKNRIFLDDSWFIWLKSHVIVCEVNHHEPFFFVMNQKLSDSYDWKRNESNHNEPTFPLYEPIPFSAPFAGWDLSPVSDCGRAFGDYDWKSSGAEVKGIGLCVWLLHQI